MARKNELRMYCPNCNSDWYFDKVTFMCPNSCNVWSQGWVVAPVAFNVRDLLNMYTEIECHDLLVSRVLMSYYLYFKLKNQNLIEETVSGKVVERKMFHAKVELCFDGTMFIEEEASA